MKYAIITTCSPVEDDGTIRRHTWSQVKLFSHREDACVMMRHDYETLRDRNEPDIRRQCYGDTA